MIKSLTAYIESLSHYPGRRCGQPHPPVSLAKEVHPGGVRAERGRGSQYCERGWEDDSHGRDWVRIY